MKEIWKDIIGYDGFYKISNYGKVRSLKQNRDIILKNQKDKSGYSIVALCKDGKAKTRTVHQLVAIHFINHKPNGHKLVVHHVDNDKDNNRSDNLKIITQRENLFTHYKGTSKYTGVSFHKDRKKWVAHIKNKW